MYDTKHAPREAPRRPEQELELARRGEACDRGGGGARVASVRGDGVLEGLPAGDLGWRDRGRSRPRVAAVAREEEEAHELRVSRERSLQRSVGVEGGGGVKPRVQAADRGEAEVSKRRHE